MAAISSSPMDASPIVTPTPVARPGVNQSHRGSVENHGNSSRSRRGGKLVSPASPWTQIVRGESDSITATPSSPSAVERVALVGLSSASSSSSSLMAEEDNSDNGTGVSAGNVGKKPAWNKPSNGSSSPEVVGVMGAESWPALSESARAPSKPKPDSFKGLSDGSPSTISVQGTEFVPPQLQSPKQVTDNANLNSIPNHAIPSRHRSFKRNGSHTTPNGSTSQPYAQHVVGDANLNNTSPRDQTQRSSLPRGTNDHQQQRSTYRNRGPGRGDGTQHNNYGGRRDHDRASQDWNTRTFNGRDSNLQAQRGVPRFVSQPSPRPPPIPTSTPFMVPAPVRPFGAPIGYHDYHMYYFPPHLDSFRGMPFFPGPMSLVFVPPADLMLHSKILNQIEYYFSNENLVKDTFLRQNMDEQGWVPISLIAGFNKVLHLTDNIQLILESIRTSNVVEVQGDRVRRRNDWMRWIISPTYTSATTGGNNNFDVNENMQNLTLEQPMGHNSGRGQVEARSEVPHDLASTGSGTLTNQSQPSVEVETASHGSVVTVSHSSARNSG